MQPPTHTMPPREDPARASADLDALLPATLAVPMRGGLSVTVRELTLAEMSKLTSAFRPIVAGFTGAGGGAPRDMLDLVSTYADAAYAIAQATTDVPAGAWSKAGASKLAAVVQTAVELNLDFFVRCVEIAALLGAVQESTATTLPNGRGLTPSDTSPGAATPSP